MYLICFGAHNSKAVLCAAPPKRSCGTRYRIQCRYCLSLMKTIIDRFGADVATEPAGKEHFRATVTASTSNTFFGWLFSFGGDMKIIAPQKVKDKYKRFDL